MRNPRSVPGGEPVSMPSVAEVEHADWPSLQRICADLGLNPKGRSAVVRMRVADYVRRRVRAPTWQPAREHQAALLTRLGFPDLSERVWESTIQLDAPAPWIGLGHAQLAGGFLGEAAKSFARSAQMGDPSAELHRAEALAASGDLEGAAGGLDAYLASHPADLRALAMRADFLSRAGFLDEALKVLEIVKTKNADALFQAGSELDRACENCHLEYWYPGDRKAVLENQQRRVLSPGKQ